MESCVLVSSHPKPKAPLGLDPSALLAITVAPKIQDGGAKTLSQDVNSFIYLSLLQSAQRANVSRGENPTPHNQHHVGLYWCAVVAAAASPAPRTLGHGGAEGLLATVHPRR